MNVKIVGVLLLGGVFAGCATGRQERVEASSEVIYEESAPDAPADPFMACEVVPQQGVAVLQCGNIVGVLASYAGELSPTAVEKNFEQFGAQFPKESKRERFTQQLGPHTASGMRVYEQSEVAPFRAELLIVPIDEGNTRIISCAVRGTTLFERCDAIVQTLALWGVPSHVPGFDRLGEQAPPSSDAESVDPDAPR
jgi:hypothetical protein